MIIAYIAIVKEFSSLRITVPILSFRLLSRYCKARLELILLKFDMFGFSESFPLVVSSTIISKDQLVNFNLSVLDVADCSFKVLFLECEAQSMQTLVRQAAVLPAWFCIQTRLGGLKISGTGLFRRYS